MCCNAVSSRQLGSFSPANRSRTNRSEIRLGQIGPKHRIRLRLTACCGVKNFKIEQRYYAIDDLQQRTTHTPNAAMAAARRARHAIAHTAHARPEGRAVARRGDFATGRPAAAAGFASMVHWRTGPYPRRAKSPRCTAFAPAASLRLRHASLAVRAGDVPNAICVASEFASRLLKASRFPGAGLRCREALPRLKPRFLRWMLSDGAGAFLLSNTPAESSISATKSRRSPGSKSFPRASSRHQHVRRGIATKYSLHRRSAGWTTQITRALLPRVPLTYTRARICSRTWSGCA